jgi:hypothetical protein
MLAAYDRSLDVLAGLGADIIDIALPFRFADWLSAQAIVQAEAYFHTGHLAEDPAVLGGARVSEQDYLANRKLQRDLKQAMYQARADAPRRLVEARRQVCSHGRCAALIEFMGRRLAGAWSGRRRLQMPIGGLLIGMTDAQGHGFVITATHNLKRQRHSDRRGTIWQRPRPHMHSSPPPSRPNSVLKISS